ncbi:MAG: M28 family metallopeptidase [Isosphaeraceae bacterium]
MKIIIATWLGSFLALCCPAIATAATPAGAIGDSLPARADLDGKKLEKHVYQLASPEFAGRSGNPANKTIAYIEKHFSSLNLKPAFASGYVQDVVQAGEAGGKRIGRNIAARVEGSDPVLSREYIIVSAHWDHLGASRDGKKVFAGADDNASGVAMLLESASWFARAENRPARSMLFVAFDLEEFGLFGSRYFAAHLPVEESAIRLFITADMIGRSLSGICREWVFVMGTERLPQSRDWLMQAQAGKKFKAGLMGTDLVGVRSDYGPFMARKVPYLFFSTGESKVYHTADDKPETLDYEKLESVSEIICETAARAARAEEIGRWSEKPVPTPEEMKVIAAVLEEMKSPASGLKIGGLQMTTLERTLASVKKMLAGGTISDADRKAVIRAVQFLKLTVL